MDIGDDFSFNYSAYLTIALIVKITHDGMYIVQRLKILIFLEACENWESKKNEETSNLKFFYLFKFKFFCYD